MIEVRLSNKTMIKKHTLSQAMHYSKTAIC